MQQWHRQQWHHQSYGLNSQSVTRLRPYSALNNSNRNNAAATTATNLPADIYYHEHLSNEPNGVDQQRQQQSQQLDMHSQSSFTSSIIIGVATTCTSAHWHQYCQAHSDIYQQQLSFIHDLLRARHERCTSTTITTNTGTVATTTTTSYWNQCFPVSGQEQLGQQDLGQQMQYNFCGISESAASSACSDVGSSLLLSSPFLQGADDDFQERETIADSSVNQVTFCPSFLLEMVTCARQQTEEEQEKYQNEAPGGTKAAANVVADIVEDNTEYTEEATADVFENTNKAIMDSAETPQNVLENAAEDVVEETKDSVDSVVDMTNELKDTAVEKVSEVKDTPAEKVAKVAEQH
ncbi:hypothetical protein BGZ95_001788 [Linnemannia exigua]|uniref:Uncharacterized protein n=1 Tax=Linnemannia exigua TaxID=604196 RepID=A0AAD4D6E0_9FUNG|nr:hypothetical protein BGZ95_001788 [Linnemannia exigua]